LHPLPGQNDAQFIIDHEDGEYVFSEHTTSLDSVKEYITGVYLIDSSGSSTSGSPPSSAASTTDFDTKIFKLKLHNDNTFFKVENSNYQLRAGQ